MGIAGGKEESEEESKGSPADCEERGLFRLAEAELIPGSLNQVMAWEGCVHCAVAPDKKRRDDLPNFFGKPLCNFMQA